MIWLDETDATYGIESNNYPAMGELGLIRKTVRVIRELVGHIEDVKAWAEYVGLFLVELAEKDCHMEELRTTAANSWNNLSPDTKELLDEKIISS